MNIVVPVSDIMVFFAAGVLVWAFVYGINRVWLLIKSFLNF